MKIVSLESLKDCARFVRDHHPDRKGDETFVSFGIATEYLRAVVGNEWTNQMVFSQHPTVSHSNQLGRKFMKVDELDTENKYRNQERTLRIAELLFNLQSVDGIDGRLDDLREGPVEATYSELEAGGFLLRHAVPFNYIDETGVRGLDYDGQIILQNGERVNCEMKCKIESTEFSESTIRNTLDTARKQLPSGKSSLVFLKIPEPWVHQSQISTLLPTVMNDFLRGTSRVVAIILRWEEVYILPRQEGSLIVYKYGIERGITPKKISSEVRNLLDQLSRPGRGPWISFRSIAEEAVQGAG